jgi:lipopolysaccharide transport system ATP-binding protein
MDDVVIRVEGLGKKYRIRHQRSERYTALRDVIADKVRAVFRSRQRTGGEPSPVEDFWALRDVSFDVRRGEALGIIGRNGAGKSTLLKILSRITQPTEGRLELDGRVASLLEVGTGCHPELTGRENIYLNGSILGMTRREIKGKFDEIVTFAEVDKFLDTPVKRYSSGMYVRLAFAIAAHLEPEILIVDEVLAVGDTEFQKKCLGKMGEVAKGGRTVVFVSHNMAAVSSLTTRGIALNAGQILFQGSSAEAIDHYIRVGHRTGATNASGKGAHTAILLARLLAEDGTETRQYTPGKPLKLEVTFVTDGSSGLSLEAFLLDANRQRIGIASLHQFHNLTLPARPGRYRCLFSLQPIPLASGNYSFDVFTSLVNAAWDHTVEDIARFEVPFSNPTGCSWDFRQSYGYGSLALLDSSQPLISEVDVLPKEPAAGLHQSP